MRTEKLLLWVSDRMITPSLKKIQPFAIFFFGFILLGTWNIPHTIGLRYISAAALLFFTSLEKPKIFFFLKESPILVITILYLIFHLFIISDNLFLSINSFKQEWSKFIFFSLLGASLGFYVSRIYSRDILLLFGISFCTPLVIHLVLFVKKFTEETALPYGYAGLSISHGDLGYAALQSSIFLTIYILFNKTYSLKNIVGIIFLILCFLSPFFSQSRGGLIFTCISVLLISIIFFSNKLRTTKVKRALFLVASMIIAIFLAFKITSIIMNDKWQDIDSRIAIGLLGDPLNVICNGIGEVKLAYEQKNGATSPQTEKIISEVDSGTTSRIVVAKAGYQLLIKNPLGLNGSKEAYQIAISRICTPTITMSNTHNGWLDLALAIGIPGLVIFLLLYLSNFTLGIRSLSSNDPSISAAGLALSTSTLIWFLRGLLDATSRDQMLEIQGFIMALMASLIIFLKTNKAKTSP